jgi:Uma2 family endonuclease
MTGEERWLYLQKIFVWPIKVLTIKISFFYTGRILINFTKMNIAEKYRPHYTYDDYCLWEGKWELIEGMPYAMSPAPNIRHQKTAAHLNALFFNALGKCKKCKVYQPIDWRIGDDTVLQPDLSVVCKPINNNAYLDFPPELVIEILSPSTAQKDRREKFAIYQQQGVKYYLIIDPAFNKIEVFELVNGNYEAVAVSPSFYSFLLDDCTAEVSFDNLFEE